MVCTGMPVVQVCPEHPDMPLTLTAGSVQECQLSSSVLNTQIRPSPNCRVCTGRPVVQFCSEHLDTPLSQLQGLYRNASFSVLF
jgi:hypothetical protein